MNIWEQHIIDCAEKGGITLTLDVLSTPPNPALGDVAIACFTAGKALSKSPGVVASELAKLLKEDVIIESATAAGPYCNVTIKPSALQTVLEKIQIDGEYYGDSEVQDETIIFEYSQPNTHKAFHIGHLRNVMLGTALANIMESQGNGVIRTTYVNDVGSHVAKCLWAFINLYGGKAPEGDRGTWLGRVYAAGEEALQKNPEIDLEMKAILKKLEAKDPELMKLWEETRSWSSESFEAIYETLEVAFDETYFESDVRANGQVMVDELLEKGIAKKSEGAIIMDLEKEGLDVLVIRKADGVGLYATSDLGLAQEKMKTAWDRSIVMTDARQSLYFKQVHETLRQYGYTRPFGHIPYEFVTLKSGNMSSRKGNVVLFQDFYAEVHGEAVAQTKERHADWDEARIETVATAITRAAITFSMLKVAPEQVITFDPADALAFDGFTGPYVLYTFARLSRIMEKATVKPLLNTDLDHPLEKQLMGKLAEAPAMLTRANEALNPAILCKFLFELSQLTAGYYAQVRILDDETKVSSRLVLVDAILQVLYNVLAILNIPYLTEM